MGGKVSVIVPVYNVEKYLECCVESILHQTYNDLEILLIDDGSSDDSKAICDRMSERDGRIRVFHADHGGVSHARNIGLNNATGDYIAFCDSDDCMDANMIERMLEALLNENADTVICNYAKVDEQGSLLRENKYVRDETVSGEEALKWLDREHYWSYVVVYTKICRRKVFEQLRFKENKIHEDEFLVHELLHNCDRVAGISDVLYRYRESPKSIMNTSSIAHLDKVEAAYERMKAYQKWGLSQLYSGPLQIAKNGFRCLASLKNQSDDDRMREREVISMFREMLRIAGKSATVSARLCGINPRAYQRILGILGK